MKKQMKNFSYYLIFDSTLCNPNGDPYTGGPRLLSDGRCIMTSQSLKYKVKRRLHNEGYPLLHYTESTELVKDKLHFEDKLTEDEVKKRALDYIDIRLFGACDLAGKLRLKSDGAVTMEMPITYDPVTLPDIAINRGYNIGLKEDGSNDGSAFANALNVLEYGLFHTYGGLNLKKAVEAGLTKDDIDAFIDALSSVFENDAAAIRPKGSMNVVKLVVWEWEGKRPYSDLELKESIKVTKNVQDSAPTSLSDYNIEIKKLNNIETHVIV